MPKFVFPEKFWKDLARQMGAPYRLGSKAKPKNNDPRDFDCSQLALWAFRRHRLKMPDWTKSQFDFTIPVENDARQDGDLAFFCDPKRFKTPQNPEGVYHVGILFLGGWNIIEARAKWRKKYGKVILTPRKKWENWKHFGGYRRHPKAFLESART